MAKKLKVGWFSFSCCEDSTIIFVELLNQYHKEWLKLLDFKHARILKRNNELKNIDVAFVEGAIASEKDAEELRKIRAESKRLVAIGACACEGMPSAQRNNFDSETKEEIRFIIERFKLYDRVLSIKEVVKVDDFVPGCPMIEGKFIEILNKYLQEFGVSNA